MGETYALACALVWAFAVIFFRKSGETFSPFSLNLFRVVVSSLLFALTMVLLRRPLLGQAPLEDYLILIVSGVIAIAFSDTLFHMCLNRVGAGLNAIVSTLYSPFIIMFAVLMLGERLEWPQFLGMVLIMSGVVVTSASRLPEGVSRRDLVIGLMLGVGSMVTLAFGIILAKPVLERSDILWATTVRQLGSLAVLTPAALLIDPVDRGHEIYLCGQCRDPEPDQHHLHPDLCLGIPERAFYPAQGFGHSPGHVGNRFCAEVLMFSG